MRTLGRDKREMYDRLGGLRCDVYHWCGAGVEH